MARYNVQILPSVIRKDLAKVAKKDVEKILLKIKSLADDPRPVLSKKLLGWEEYRLRQGKYRILYLIKDDGVVVLVVKVAKRETVYR